MSSGELIVYAEDIRNRNYMQSLPSKLRKAAKKLWKLCRERADSVSARKLAYIAEDSNREMEDHQLNEMHVYEDGRVYLWISVTAEHYVRLDNLDFTNWESVDRVKEVIQSGQDR